MCLLLFVGVCVCVGACGGFCVCVCACLNEVGGGGTIH